MTVPADPAAHEGSIRVVLTAPEVTPEGIVDAWRERVAGGGSSLVLSESMDAGGGTWTPIVEQADRHLERAGATVPDPLHGGGRYLEPGPTPELRPAAWFEHLTSTGRLQDSFLQTVRSPKRLVETLERLLLDGICPSEDGWFDGAADRLNGNPLAVRRRSERIAAVVPALDADAVVAALERTDHQTLAQDLLEHYLTWCLDGNVATPGLRSLAGAVDRVEPEADHVLVLAEGMPPTSAVRIAQSAASESVTLAIPAASPVQATAWTADTGELTRAIATRAVGLEPEDIDARLANRDSTGVHIRERGRPEGGSRATLIEPARLAATIWTRDTAADPVDEAVSVVDWLCTENDSGFGGAAASPDEIHVTVPTPAHARRFMRRVAAAGAPPAARIGHIEVFRTRIAVLSLAWLRIIEGTRPDRGWAVVLEEAGCSLGDLDAWLSGHERPAAFASLRGELRSLPDGLAVVAAVADRYETDPRATHALLGVLGGADRPPSTSEVLDRLSTSVEGGPMVPLEPTAHAAVRVTPRQPTEPTPIVVHLDIAVEVPEPALAYSPPLGLHPTRTVTEQNGHAIERPHPAWSTLSVVREGERTRRRQRAVAASARAGDHVVIVGREPVLRGRPVPMD